MAPLAFPSLEALRLVLTSGLVPDAVRSAPARVRFLGEGGLLVTPDVTLGALAVKALAELGVREVREASGEGSAVSCWAEILPLGRAPHLDVPTGPVLFLPAHEHELLPLAGELLRLGCDRQELCFSGSGAGRRALLKAFAPPYFTLTRALDRVAGLRAFEPVPSGPPHAVWLELGHTHPLARTLQPPPGTLLLLPGEGRWMTAPEGPWRDLYQLVDLQLPEPLEDWTPRPAPGRLAVPLRLSRSTRVAPASLWVLHENAVAQVEALVQSLPEPVLARLRFAVSGPAESPRVVLRVRPGREPPPELGLSGLAYAPLPQLPQLYLPREARLEPPLSERPLRALFTPEADTLTWLHPTGPGSFRAERLPESAFQPLDGWVDYLLDTAAVALEPWVKGATFDFESFVATDPGPSGAPPPSADAESSARRPSGRSLRPVPATPPPLPAPQAVRSAPPPPLRLVPLTPAQVSAAEEALAAREKDFLALEAPADAPERLRLWDALAEGNRRLGRTRDARLCWTRILWESSGAEAASLVARWAPAGAEGPSPAERMALADPSEEDVRALAHQVLRVSHGAPEPLDVPAVQRWMDRHDGGLDVRSLWLTRVALARLAGGDALGLAQTADRVLSRMHQGLSRVRDVPTFLRASGDVTHSPRLRAQLDALLARFESARRRRSALEAPVALTQAYVRWVFAWGFARLGHVDRAQALVALATSALEPTEPVHGLLSRSYAARVAQALEGAASGAPLPDALAAELNALSGFHRFKVDRLRQSSSLLEPSERLDPMRSFGRGTRDPRGEEFAELREVKDPARLVECVERLVAQTLSPQTAAPERQRLLEGLFGTLFRLPPARALPLCSRLVPALEGLPEEVQASLLGDALGVASHFGREDHVRTLVGRLRALLEGLGPEAEAWSHGILGVSLRELRRLGLTSEATALLQPGQRLLAQPTRVPLSNQLGIAAGLAQLGHLPEAMAVFERAFTTLASFKGPMPERLALARGLAGALSQAPLDVALPALARLSEQLANVTDSYNTNSHFCLSVVEFADVLVQGHVGVGQGSGERVRRWLDEDEFLVRRRIHRELEEHP